MALDYAGLWILVLANTLAILLLVRRLALLPQVTRRQGPRAGTPVGDWALRSVDGRLMQSAQLADAYTLLFVASTCGPCHALFEDLRAHGRPSGRVYVIGQGDLQSLAAKAPSSFDLVLEGGSGDLYQRLDVPGTPWAVAIRHGLVEVSGAAATAAQLARVTEVISSSSGDLV